MKVCPARWSAPATVEAMAARLNAAMPPALWLFLLCLAFVYPAITMTSAHFEEGTTIALARGAFEDGHWLTPYRYGLRFPERPDLVSVVLGVVGAWIGWMPDFVPRLLVFAALYGGAWLVHRLVATQATPTAALFAALAFLASPLVIPKLVTAEVDVIVATLEFAGFFLWWRSPVPGSPGLARIAAIGLVLASAALVKGPQPLGFFFAGLGLYTLANRRWADFARLVAIGTIPLAALLAWYAAVHQPGDIAHWLGHSRLTTMPVGEWLYRSIRLAVVFLLVYLPAVIVIMPALGKRQWEGAAEQRSLFEASLFYALAATAALIVWPSANERYAMPAILGIAAAGGLAFDRLATRRTAVVRGAIVVTTLLCGYVAVLHFVVQPLAPDLFQPSRNRGRAVAAAIEAQPATLRVSHFANHLNLWVYVRGQVRNEPFETLMTHSDPFWACVTPQELLEWRAAQPARKFDVVLSDSWPLDWRLVRVGARAP